MWIIFAILAVICLDAYTLYLATRPREGPWERLVKCSEMSQGLAETAVIYRKIGMNEDADSCWREAQRLHEETMAIMTGQNNA
jgi:hypothetical protein